LSTLRGSFIAYHDVSVLGCTPQNAGGFGQIHLVTQVPSNRLLVVDDDPNLLRMLRRGLILAGYAVDAVEDGYAALRVAREQEPDLLVLDVMLPEPLDGLEIARRLRAAGVDAPILMLTARGQLDDKLAGFQSGADDYLPKPFEFEELLARIRALLRRHARAGQPTASQRLQYADLELDLATREVWRSGEPLDLTAREFDVLVYFLRHPRQVLTRDQVFRAIWASDFLGGSNIIDANVYSLRTKLESGGHPRLIQTVRGVGYALRS
jgi:two-component system, OmpR family, response regulator MprA